ncbi:MAG: phosphatidylserine decarboxylase [Verrucomicrobiota bacterium]|nr:phosphatidylserine decarboxylase [Limisphaera sp.]MDW8382455.1 phosphatidylserine decarboxylase [Verrucomicrobiota bacterium]
MRHAGKARQAALRMVGWTLGVLALVLLGALVARVLGSLVLMLSTVLIAIWAGFALFTLYFFRDPTPRLPASPGVIVAPAYGRVDVVDRIQEPWFLGGECYRISIFLSVFDVHVQYAPVSGRVALRKHTPGAYLSALRTDSGQYNENVLLGLETNNPAGERVAVRLIAGVVARRIVPFVEAGEELDQGDRLSLIQYGSRVELYLPLRVRLQVQPGDRVRGGETIVAFWD